MQQGQHLQSLPESHAMREYAAASGVAAAHLLHRLEARVPHKLHALVLKNIA